MLFLIFHSPDSFVLSHKEVRIIIWVGLEGSWVFPAGRFPHRLCISGKFAQFCIVVHTNSLKHDAIYDLVLTPREVMVKA